MLKEEIEKTLEHLKSELAKVRAGKASIELVENIEVAAYNSKMPLKQLATLSSPEPRLILISPWDKSIIKDIESAIRNAISDINPAVESDLIRLSFPAPSEERRRELVKEVGRIVEEAKIRIRRIREEALGDLKSQQERGEISEDEMHKRREESQKLIDGANKDIEGMRERKESEVMEI